MKYDVSLQTIAWINGRRTDGTLEISPKFQRRAVWMEAERKALIGTIMDGLPFPEIYVQHQTDINTGAEKHIVVDGQQRITSILMFIDNEISLPIEGDWNGQYFSRLDEEQKAKFWNYKVVVRGLSNANDVEIRDLFQRLNTNNISLNDQELRNARYKGRFKAAAENIADNSIFQSFGLFTAREIRRMVDIEFASELLIQAIAGITNKKDLIDVMFAEFEEEFPGESEYVADVETTLSLVRSVVNETNKPVIRTRSNFYSVFGSCLKYYRRYSRAAFHRTDAVSNGLSCFLLNVKNTDVNQMSPIEAEYFEAVSRAASDRGRRVRREEILFNLISRLDANLSLSSEEDVTPEILASGNS